MPGKWGGARRARPPLDPPMQVEILGKTKVTKTSNDTFMTWAG